MAVVGVVLAVLAVIPWQPLGRLEALVAAVLVLVASTFGVLILGSSASIYADGSTHWDHTPHGAAVLGGVCAVVALAILLSARTAPVLMRVGLAVGSLGTMLLTASQFAYHTPG